MPNLANLDKYFWDHTQEASDAFKLKRLFEYAGFPDLLKIPFDYVKAHFHQVDIPRLRTVETRIRFLQRIEPVLDISASWEEAIFKMCGI